MSAGTVLLENCTLGTSMLFLSMLQSQCDFDFALGNRCVGRKTLETKQEGSVDE